MRTVALPHVPESSTDQKRKRKKNVLFLAPRWKTPVINTICGWLGRVPVTVPWTHVFAEELKDGTLRARIDWLHPGGDVTLASPNCYNCFTHKGSGGGRSGGGLKSRATMEETRRGPRTVYFRKNIPEVDSYSPGLDCWVLLQFSRLRMQCVNSQQDVSGPPLNTSAAIIVI